MSSLVGAGDEGIDFSTFHDVDLWSGFDMTGFPEWVSIMKCQAISLLTVIKNLSSLFDDPFASPDLLDMTQMTYPIPSDTLPFNIQTALDMIQQYQHPTSGTNTPFVPSVPHRWFSDRPSLQLYDSDVVNVFINLATKHIGKAFPVLKVLGTTASMESYLHLAAAAVGGLYCKVHGSYNIAKSMYHDSRRLVGDRVGQPHVFIMKFADSVDKVIQ